MKIRSGFVSNSSSSSFIVKVGHPFKTALEVAEYMIPHREWESDAERLAQIQEMKIDDKQYDAISFQSCNYETFIAHEDGYFLIETCNNHDWDMYRYHTSCPMDVTDGYGEYLHKLSTSRPFYNLEMKVTGCPMSYEEGYRYESRYCKKCYKTFWYIGDSYQCPDCGKKAELKHENSKRVRK